jgi:hypothetical protein
LCVHKDALLPVSIFVQEENNYAAICFLLIRMY